MALKQIDMNGEQIIVGGNGALVASKSEPGTWHAVRLVGVERTCDCKGFEFRHTCRHVKAVEELVKAQRQAKAQPPKPVARPAYIQPEGPFLPESAPQPRRPVPTFEQMFGAAVA